MLGFTPFNPPAKGTGVTTQDIICKMFTVFLLLVTKKQWFFWSPSQFNVSDLPVTCTQFFLLATLVTQLLSFIIFLPLGQFPLIGWGFTTTFLTLLSMLDLFPGWYSGLSVRFWYLLARQSLGMLATGLLLWTTNRTFLLMVRSRLYLGKQVIREETHMQWWVTQSSESVLFDSSNCLCGLMSDWPYW